MTETAIGRTGNLLPMLLIGTLGMGKRANAHYYCRHKHETKHEVSFTSSHDNPSSYGFFSRSWFRHVIAVKASSQQYQKTNGSGHKGLKKKVTVTEFNMNPFDRCLGCRLLLRRLGRRLKELPNNLLPSFTSVFYLFFRFCLLPAVSIETSSINIQRFIFPITLKYSFQVLQQA